MHFLADEGFNLNCSLRCFYKAPLSRNIMGTEKYLSVDLDDPRAAAIASVLVSKTCKQILMLLADREMSESDLAKALHLPLNTLEYNIKKLLKAELIVQSGRTLWSVKGKRIRMYKVARQKILIAPVQRQKGIIATMIFSVATALLLRTLLITFVPRTEENFSAQKASLLAAPAAAESSVSSASAVQSSFSQLLEPSLIWIWFLFGALLTLLFSAIWAWRNKR